MERGSAGALDMLRMAAYGEPEPSAGFDQRVIRKFRINGVQEGMRYWAPAAVGAGIACIGLFAALHLATVSGSAKRVDLPESQAKNAPSHRYPSLALSRVPEFTR